MGRRNRRASSFFKVLVGNYKDRMEIPPKFVMNFKQDMPKICTLSSPVRESWKVEVDHVDGGLYFRKGWRQFVEDHCLEFGDFLLFRKGEKSGRFKVEIYGKTCCPKNLSSISKRKKSLDQETVQIKEEEEDDVVLVTEEPPPCMPKKATPSRFSANEFEDEQAEPKMKSVLLGKKTGHGKRKQPYFVIEVKKYHKYYLCLPRSFAEETRILSKQGVVLEDARGRQWPVSIKTNPNKRIDFAKGWMDFRKCNDIKDGDTCMFTFLGGDEVGLISAHIFRKKPKSAKKSSVFMPF